MTRSLDGARVLPIVLAAAGVAGVLAVTAVLLSRWPSIAPADTGEKSIAVLPFVNLSSDQEQAYFPDGIAEDVLNLLTEVRALKVVARTSSFSFKDQELEVLEIARRLGVTHVLQGSVRKDGNQVQVIASLVRAADGRRAWSRSWDRPLGDVFRIQDEIVAAVLGELRVAPGVQPTATPVEARVYSLILHAQALTNQGSLTSLAEAVALYQQAVELAPNEARAWAGLSRAYFNLAANAKEPGLNSRLAKQSANKALSLDPDNVLALVALGRMASDFELDLPLAARYYQRALELQPGNLVVINAAAILLMYAGRLEESLALFEYRVDHDPANPAAHNNVGNNLYFLGRWDAADDAFRSTLQLSPDYAGVHTSMGLTRLLGRNDAAGALKEFEAETDPAARQLGIPLAMFALGRKDEALAAFRAAVDRFQDEQAMVIAANYAYFGDTDQAFEWLGRAIAANDPFVSGLVVDPLLRPLASDPRWLPFLRRIGFAPEQLARIEFRVALPRPAGR